MSQYLRLAFVYASFVAIGTVGIVYAKAAKPLIKMGTGNGQFSGFLSDEIAHIDTVVPLVLALLLLGTAVYFLVGGVRDEKSVKRRPRR